MHPNLFDYQNFIEQLPKAHFDLVVISHCFFYDRENRDRSCTAYNKLFRYLLSPNGYVLLIIQVNKLYGLIGAYPEEKPKIRAPSN